jgi:dethiobiotin synthetase
VDLGLVETVGGPRSPIAHDGDGVDLAQLLVPDAAVLVADAGLGTINAVRLSVAVLAPVPVVVLLNRFDPSAPLHESNRRWLADVDHLEVVTAVADLLPRLGVR